MRVQPGWQQVFQAPRTEKVILCTLLPHGGNPIGPRHPALEPGAICAATHRNAVVRSVIGNTTIPFWPNVLDWPVVESVLSLSNRRAEISDTPVRLGPGAGAAPRLLDAGGGTFATMRLDLWSPGITLENTQLLAAGRVRNLDLQRADGPVQCTLTDGDPERTVTYPLDTLTAREFPDAPPWVADSVPATVIIGQAPDRVVCIPIELRDDGTCARWFLCAPRLTAPPTRIEHNGVNISGAQTRDVTTSDTSGFGFPSYTLILLDTPVPVTDEISASGAVGILEQNPILFLLDVAGYSVTAEARARLLQLNALDFSVLLNKSGDIKSLLEDQLLPQTTLVSTFRHGAFHVFDLADDSPRAPLGLGTGLQFRLADQPQPTDDRDVANVVEVRCGRDHFASTAPDPASLLRIVRDAEHGPRAVRNLLAKSRALYGSRALAKAIDALDLAVTRNPDTGVPIACPAGDRLADLVATLSAFAPRVHAYQADWWRGWLTDVGHRIALTDPTQRLNAKPTRIVRWALPATGPTLTFQELQEAA